MKLDSMQQNGDKCKTHQSCWVPLFCGHRSWQQVSAEILQVSRRQQPGTVAELCIIDKVPSNNEPKVATV